MAQVVAVSEIRHGMADGDIKVFNIGDTVSGLSDDEVRSLIAAGAVVEIGKGRKFTPEPVPGTAAAADDATRKRDELLAKSLMAVDEDTPADPATELAAGAPDANAGGDKTIAQTAAEKDADKKDGGK